MLFWTIGEYSLSYYGWIWRKAHRLLSSESSDQWVKWSYEFESKFDKERNYAFKSVTLLCLLDCRNIVSFAPTLGYNCCCCEPLCSYAYPYMIFYASWSSHLEDSISFDVQIMCAASRLIDAVTESFSTSWLDNNLGILISGFELYFNLFYSNPTRNIHITAEIQLCSEVHQDGFQSCETFSYTSQWKW